MNVSSFDVTLQGCLFSFHREIEEALTQIGIFTVLWTKLVMCGPLYACNVVGKTKMILEDKFQVFFLLFDFFSSAI